MKYCNKCGNQIADEAVICVQCGNQIEDIKPATPQNVPLKNNKIAMILFSVFLGELGIDRFILGHVGMGILKLLTAGCFGILWIIDIILIATGKLGPADGSGYIE